jgi:hypothetical protein
MSRLACFKNLHRGKRGVIVCNGPSLNRMDLGFLRNELVIGLNKIHLGLERFDFYPRYLVAVNPRVVEQSRDALRAMTATKFIGERAASHLPEDTFTHHLPILGAPVVFSRDITKGVREGGTVTHVGLQIAWYLGFSEVVIIGMDHRFSFHGAPHEAHRLEGSDLNHFSPEYFSGQVWDNPDLIRSEESYAMARQVYESDGRRILDATPDGACQVFEKRDYRRFFGMT